MEESRFRSLLRRNPQRETQKVSPLQTSFHTPCSVEFLLISQLQGIQGLPLPVM